VGEDGLQVGLAERPHRLNWADPRRRRRARGEDWPFGCSFLVVLAGGPLRAVPATLLVGSGLVGAFAGRLGGAGGVGGTLLGLDPLDGAAGPLPCDSLGPVPGLAAKRPVGISDLVGAPVLLDLGRGLTPGPPTRVDPGTGPSASRT
jgi:hypothetical protein